jgi:cobalt-zinc-cadmium efflux system outer membrane protein
VLPRLGETPVGSIDQRRVRRFITDMLGDGVSSAQVRKAVGRLKQTLDLAVELGTIRKNPCNAGLRLLQETNDEAFVFGVSMPLFAGARYRGAVAEAEALRAKTDAERDAHRVRAEAQLFELHQELRHAITEAEALNTSVLPEMEAALEATRYAFERGRYSYLEWVDAQRELVDVQRALIEAAANAHLYRAEIERLTGEPLVATN